MTRVPPQVAVAVFTHPGRGKPKDGSGAPPARELESHNEDTVAVGDWVSGDHMYVPKHGAFLLGAPLLFLVADGVGGGNAGEVASAMAAAHFVEHAARLVDEAGVRAVVEEAHRAILEAGEANPEQKGMGTTVAGLVLTGATALWFNVGDSRVYRFRDGFLQQTSQDDVTLMERRRAEEEQRTPNLISAFLGGPRPILDPHVFVQPLPARGRWMLCTDGVSDPVDAQTLEACMKPAPLETVLAIYDVVMRAQAPDNLSVIVVDLEPSQPVFHA